MNQENKEDKNKENENKNALTEEEKEEAKQNGFILVGKTGTGKTTVLNMMFNKVVGKVAKSFISCTEESSVYYYKLKNGKTVSLVDTPGLSDSSKTENKNIDKLHLEGISDIIVQEKIHIKGILFLVNFQNERFDADEQFALLEYNRIFPLKDFWKSLVVIYTHFYPDPDDDKTEEEMMEERTISNEKIFSTLMEKVKKVSKVITYQELKKKYFNSHSDPNNKKKILRNNQNREEMEALLDELCKNEPLFNRVEVTTIKNHKWNDEEDGKVYIGEVKIVSYYDFNDEPLKETLHIISKKEVQKNFKPPPPSYSCTEYRGGYVGGGGGNDKQEINYVKNDEVKPKPINEHKINETIDYSKKAKGAAIGAALAGGGAAVGVGVAGVVGGVAILSNPVGWAVAGVSAVGALFGWMIS